MTEAERRTVRFPMMLSPSEAGWLDEFRWGNRIATRAEAARRLIKKGLEASASEVAAGEGPGKANPAAEANASAGNAG